MKILLSDFTFLRLMSGHYKVTYISPKTNRAWSSIITYMPLIDNTILSDSVKQKDLNELKRICKMETIY